ncbi:MAG TPA: S8 family peptidase [Bryobacteraceae bacterium]|nr:S8 family peptidase [Bryobacteraceae bacterium]
MASLSEVHRLFLQRSKRALGTGTAPRLSKAWRGVALLLSLALAGSALADNSKISPDLQPLLSNQPGEINVIVQYNSLPQTCLSSGLLAALPCLVGGVVNTVFTLINAVAGTISTANIVSLSDQANVRYISLDRSLSASLDYSAAGVDAPLAWNLGWDGTGIGIAVIDSGIYPHPDLLSAGGQSRIVYRKTFIGGVQNDDFGHGTHVAGIIAGSGATSNVPGSFHVLRGIAPNANLLDLRVLDQNGLSNDSVVIAAIQAAVQLKNQYNVRVMNLSLGRPIYESCTLDPLCEAAESAWQNGIVVVAAAGNLGRNGYATVLSPGNSPHAITVGAMKTEGTYTPNDDMIASYSSKGPTYIDLTVKPDLVAPGNLVVSLLAPGSTLVNAYPQNVVGPSYYGSTSTGPAEYMRLSGTSMATPVVSGAVALLLQKDPTLSPDAVKARLMKTARKTFPVSSVATDPTTGRSYTSFYDVFTIGAGYLDVAGALADDEPTFLSSASPGSFYNPFSQQGHFVLPLLSNWLWLPAWSTTEVWGTTVLSNGAMIWNSPNVWGSSSTWGTSMAWGTNNDSGTSMAWGTNTDSGTSMAWGTSGQGEP